MWIEDLSNNQIIYRIYDKIPELEKIRVEEFSFLEGGKKIKVVFDMPRFADYPPQKWKKCNTISVELDFWNIKHFDFKEKLINPNFLCCILIKKETGLKISISGSISCEFEADIGIVQKLHAYCTL